MVTEQVTHLTSWLRGDLSPGFSVSHATLYDITLTERSLHIYWQHNTLGFLDNMTNSRRQGLQNNHISTQSWVLLSDWYGLHIMGPFFALFFLHLWSSKGYKSDKVKRKRTEVIIDPKQLQQQCVLSRSISDVSLAGICFLPTPSQVLLCLFFFL